MTSTGNSIVSLQNEGFPTFCLCLTTGRRAILVLRRNYGICMQMVVRELLLGQCCNGLSLSSQFHVCGRTCYKLYSGKPCILGEEKQLGGETVGLQYPAWLLHNIDSNVKKHTQQPMSVCMCYETRHNQKLYTPSDGYRHSIHHVRSNY